MRFSSFDSRFVRRCRTGLTLMELVVVMVILIALAGIVLPLLPSMSTRAHTSTTATNATEASKAVQLYDNLYSGYPFNLDNLITGSGSLASYLAAGASGDLIPYQLQSADINALSSAFTAPPNSPGIPTVLPVIENPGTTGSLWSPTFNPYSASAMTINATTGQPSVAVPLYTGTLPATGPGITVVGVTQAAVTRELGVVGGTVTSTVNGNTTTSTGIGTYVMFGLGDYSSMAGRTLEEAPVHFDDSSSGQPNVIYGRFGLVFQTQDGSGTALVAAKFIGTVDLADTGGITDASDHLQTYYQLK